MENDSETAAFFTFLVNFVHDNSIMQFVEQNGECLPATFHLINWHLEIDDNNNSKLSFLLISI